MTKNLVYHNPTVTRKRRERISGHKSVLLWFTGLSGSGKSTIAHTLEEELYHFGYRTFVLDGDNIRHDLSADLGFSRVDRDENIRRIAQVAKLMLEAGIITMTAFISPFQIERRAARKIFADGDFIEIFCNASLEVCKKRDTKGLYKKALAGEIKNYTGINSPYETPQQPELVLDTDKLSIKQSVDMVLELLRNKRIIK